MAGLLGMLLAGGGSGVGGGMQQNAQMAQQFNLVQLQNEVKALMDERIADRTRQEKTADYETRKADDIAAEERRVKNEKGLIAARRDPSEAKLNELKLQQAESDVKVPSAVRMEYETLKKNNEIISSSLYKAQAEGTYTPETAAKAEAAMNANTKRMSELLRPHQGDQAPKEKKDIDLSLFDKMKAKQDVNKRTS